MNAVWAFGCCWTADPAEFPVGINVDPVPVITVSTLDERDIFSIGRSISGLLRITTSGFRMDESGSTFRDDESPENGVLELIDSRCSIAPVDRCDRLV